MSATGRRGRRALAGLIGAAALAIGGVAAAAPDAPLPQPRPAAINEPPTAPQPPAEAVAAEESEESVAPLPRSRPAAAADESVAAEGAHAAPAVPEVEGPPIPAGKLTSTAGDLSPLRPAPSGSGAAMAAIDSFARTPRSRPDARRPGRLALVAPTLTEPVPEAPMAPPVPIIAGANDQACLARLKGLGVAFTPMPPIDTGGACAVAAPLQVAAFGSGVTVVPEATMNCRTTEAMALWVRDVLVRASKAGLGAVPTRIVPGSTYACRPRNNQDGAKLSEHAQANAFDVMGVVFADRPPIEIGPRGLGDREGRFQAEIRRKSCAYFTTVLGPGSDASHANHLHFDLAERRGGYRLCSLGETRTAGPPVEKTKRE